jgi:hypothetical protein
MPLEMNVSPTCGFLELKSVSVENWPVKGVSANSRSQTVDAKWNAEHESPPARTAMAIAHGKRLRH